MSDVSSVLQANGHDLAEDLAATAIAVAARFSRGGSMWCLAPGHPEHGRHLAVEFVHPVIVGKPALPAISVDVAAPVDAVRSLVSAGDIVVVVGDAEPAVLDVLQRCPAWGATAVWIGAGRRPRLDTPAHLLWVDDDTGTAHHDGRLVQTYHLLWELTHVCLEHGAGVVDEDPCMTDDVCVTCADEALLGEIITTSPDGGAAVRIDGTAQQIDVSLVDDAGPGDLVLVHAGVAISGVDPLRAG